MNSLKFLIDKHYQSCGDIIIACHQALKELYPELIVRWARIYGYRWAFMHGQAAGDIGRATVKVQLNQDYGLCIDNAGIIAPGELDTIIGTLKKEYFVNGNYGGE